ncbi:Immunoglobulin subtype,Immunoglobulin-like domain,Immunoglobulin-like fold,Immunoglobulin subtype [Cinara cedri]|uniref:Immunoglobulin subtype,Immunoglobulin-like domain,Immunoglobulin-like fold,Immunoglobulin subtype n=1 Tax=Cinara cedri TaxID=506608 RepID=A0A5E4NKB7_9HEMI|nr:Immunoglobulin subtype,Immunoglobulin-like domain,Immunoglobulin-like fold,Immunoglobulin subtype [Cinara cedri]
MSSVRTLKIDQPIRCMALLYRHCGTGFRPKGTKTRRPPGLRLNVIAEYIIWGVNNVCHAQEIVYINKDIIRGRGEMAQLSCCIIDNYDDIPVSWVKLNNSKMAEPLILSVSGTLIFSSSRFSVRATDGCYNLTISDIQEIDDAAYQCTININLHTKLFAQVMLKVKRSPFILSNSTKSFFVTEGEPVSLECYAEGYPNPKIFWKRVNAEILPAPHVGSAYKGNILQISRVNRKDRGTYSCIADNGVGRGVRYSVTMQVKCAPSIIIPRPKVEQALRQNINLECHVDAFPTPAIVWFKIGQQLYNYNDHYSISERVITDEITEGILSIASTTYSHYGDYICKAINGLGSAEAIIRLVQPSISQYPIPADLRTISFE